MEPWWCYQCLGDVVATVESYHKVWNSHLSMRIESFSLTLVYFCENSESCHKEDTYLIKKSLVFSQIIQSWWDHAVHHTTACCKSISCLSSSSRKLAKDRSGFPQVAKEINEVKKEWNKELRPLMMKEISLHHQWASLLLQASLQEIWLLADIYHLERDTKIVTLN